MEERHRKRLEALLQASKLNEWDQRSTAERCEGWWPSLAAFVAEKASGSKEPVPADLRRLRGLIHRAFTPARVTAMKAGIDALVERLLDAAEARGGPIDLIRDLALPLPLTGA